MKFNAAALAALLCLAPITQAFVSPQLHAKHVAAPKIVTSFNPTGRKCSFVTRSMYNLPPGGGGSGGGGGGKEDGIQGILTGVGTIAAIALFFASPLGSIFFAITNSLFLLALLLPVVGYIGFQAWQTFYTMEGPCPSCGAQCRVLKDSSSTPSFCFNCGAIVQASASDPNTIEIAQESPVVETDGSVSSSSASSIFDMLMNQESLSVTDTTTSANGSSSSSSSTPTEKASQFRREQTIIDVEVEDE